MSLILLSDVYMSRQLPKLWCSCLNCYLWLGCCQPICQRPGKSEFPYSNSLCWWKYLYTMGLRKELHVKIHRKLCTYIIDVTSDLARLRFASGAYGRWPSSKHLLRHWLQPVLTLKGCGHLWRSAALPLAVPVGTQGSRYVCESVEKLLRCGSSMETLKEKVNIHMNGECGCVNSKDCWWSQEKGQGWARLWEDSSKSYFEDEFIISIKRGFEPLEMINTCHLFVRFSSWLLFTCKKVWTDLSLRLLRT